MQHLPLRFTKTAKLTAFGGCRFRYTRHRTRLGGRFRCRCCAVCCCCGVLQKPWQLPTHDSGLILAVPLKVKTHLVLVLLLQLRHMVRQHLLKYVIHKNILCSFQFPMAFSSSWPSKTERTHLVLVPLLQLRHMVWNRLGDVAVLLRGVVRHATLQRPAAGGHSP